MENKEVKINLFDRNEDDLSGDKRTSDDCKLDKILVTVEKILTILTKDKAEE